MTNISLNSSSTGRSDCFRVFAANNSSILVKQPGVFLLSKGCLRITICDKQLRPININ